MAGMTTFETIAIVLFAVLAISQFVTMISNVTGNIAHRRQMQDVRAMREAQQHDIEAEQAFRKSIESDMLKVDAQLAELRSMFDGITE